MTLEESPMQTQMLINGQLIAGQGPAWTVLNPALGTALAQINEATEAQVDSAVRAADQAFDSWSQTSPKERSQALLALADAIEAHGITDTIMVPSMLQAMLDLPGFDARRVQSLNRIAFGAAPMPPDLLDRALDHIDANEPSLRALLHFERELARSN